jgi:hypothetical protein
MADDSAKKLGDRWSERPYGIHGRLYNPEVKENQKIVIRKLPVVLHIFHPNLR